MANWSSATEQKLKDVYVEFNIPSDTLIADETLMSKFVERFIASSGCSVDFSAKSIAEKLLSLRKKGELPRLRK